MHPFIKAVMVAVPCAAVAACSSSTTAPVVPSGTVTFTNPVGGEDYQIGDTVELAWSCPDCANVPAGDPLSILAYDGTNSYLLDGTAQVTDSVSWVAGTTLDNVSLLPGIYLLVAQDADGYYTSQSRFFQLSAGG